GRHLTDSDLADTDIQYHLENCISRIQTYAVENISRRNYLSYIHLYSDQLTDFQGLTEIEDAASIIDNSVWGPVIGHHDLILENVIYDGQKMYFIDWEYAHLGHPLIDHIKLFGRDYCANKADIHTINALETLQRGIEKLWYAVQDSQTKNHRESQE
ncbi:MAG: phosphotransferase, partial [Porticoccaceae bacterium]|nr:phosphotransferase [Porticoccaceae bacterium]